MCSSWVNDGIVVAQGDARRTDDNGLIPHRVGEADSDALITYGKPDDLPQRAAPSPTRLADEDDYTSFEVIL